MAPIRTAIIGLSASGGWAKNAHLPYLISPAGKSKYNIIALCNSSVKSAKQAIEAYGFPPDTRAYGSPEDVAADPDVELVIVSTRVDKHYETGLPSIKAGKNVYVEWPLAHNVDKARELAELARETGAKTVIGLQGWYSPIVLTLQELLSSGRIGKVLSSQVRGTGGTKDREAMTPAGSYFTDKKIGGNFITIIVGHVTEYIQHVLGDFENVQSRLQIQRPQVKIVDPASGQTTKVVESDVPDLAFIQGTLPASATVVQGASISITIRRGQPFKGEPGLDWIIHGEKGEIRVRTYDGPAFNAGGDGAIIEVYDFASDEVHKVDWAYRDEYAGLPTLAQNIGALYDAFASGDRSKYPDFERAVTRHKQLDGILNDFSQADGSA
ncbi:hypothetical protein PFICI_04893 [Pestalotiopsis fici W106-1]|uniref:Uncharacterized protein n=1 Tax=Pestalotiopsis fici (strain W106-1 / CGMCC3.15140) TaxID=1229662 RepID=W3XC44_PESFW|nr:uncharacterized protein PFICI_04893 [Pestalotiopsis fici W106-1]ETS83017.1 hypothetical protein PFICI_04893 [Pestalotiopsis fici W106-1]